MDLSLFVDDGEKVERKGKGKKKQCLLYICFIWGLWCFYAFSEVSFITNN